MQTDFRAKYKNVYEDTKKDMLKEITDEDLNERVRIALPSYANLRPAA